MKNFRKVKQKKKKTHIIQSKIIFKDFQYQYWIVKREEQRYGVEFYSLLWFFIFLFFYVFLLFLKINENYFTLFLKMGNREQ